MSIHKLYAEMGPGDKELCDLAYEAVRTRLIAADVPASVTDHAERLVEAIAVYVVASRAEAEASIELWREGWRKQGREDFIEGRSNRTEELRGKPAVLPYSEGWASAVADDNLGRNFGL